MCSTCTVLPRLLKLLRARRNRAGSNRGKAVKHLQPRNPVLQTLRQMDRRQMQHHHRKHDRNTGKPVGSPEYARFCRKFCHVPALLLFAIALHGQHPPINSPTDGSSQKPTLADAPTSDKHLVHAFAYFCGAYPCIQDCHLQTWGPQCKKRFKLSV